MDLYITKKKAQAEPQIESQVRKPFNPDEVLKIDIAERSASQKGKKRILLQNIHMTIPKGTLNLILGGSGAGKTTFMNAVMGYEKAVGTVLYDGMDVYKDYRKMIHEIGYVPQRDDHALRQSDDVFSTLIDCAKMRLPQNLPKEALYEMAIKTLSVVGLLSEKNSRVSKLSGGQQKRLNIATQYIANPSLFFLDEPDSGLDTLSKGDIFESLRRIANEGKIVLVISHCSDDMVKYYDNVICLAKGEEDNIGKLAFYGSVKGAFSFFGTDSFTGILKEINSSNMHGKSNADYYINRYAEEYYR